MQEVRKEYKFLYSKQQLYLFLNSFDNSLKLLYPERVINSLYLDTSNYKYYFDAVKNDVNKTKLRFRQYGSENQIYFEKKINNSNGKFKEKEKVKIKSFNEVENILYEGNTLTPVLTVNYLRKYFLFKNVRITIDENINYISTKNRTLHHDEKSFDKIIVEFKLFDSNPDIESFFITNPIAFSKFINGMEVVYNL